MQAMLGQEPPIQRLSTTAVRRPDCAWLPGHQLAAAPAAEHDHIELLWLRHPHLHPVLKFE
jgi:hypothetical protein